MAKKTSNKELYEKAYDVALTKEAKRLGVVKKKRLTIALTAIAVVAAAGAGYSGYAIYKSINENKLENRLVIDPSIAQDANITELKYDAEGNASCEVHIKEESKDTKMIDQASTTVYIGQYKLTADEYDIQIINDVQVDSGVIVTIHKDVLNAHQGKITVNPGVVDITFDITFDTSDKVLEGDPVKTQTIKKYGKAICPYVRAHDGCVAKKWQYKEDGVLKDFEFETTEITQAYTLYPVWEMDVRYTTIFRDESKETEEEKVIDTQTILKGKTFTQPPVSRTGYKLVGWYTLPDGGEEWDFSTTVTGETGHLNPGVLYARWEEIKATGITLNKTSLGLVTNDSTKTTFVLEATVNPEGTLTKSVQWSSSDPDNVASVVRIDDNTAIVTAIGNGECVITCTSDSDPSVTATCNVTVTTDAESIALDQSSIIISANSSKALVETISPATTSDKSVKWTTSDSDVATVVNGVVKGVAAGTATITATTHNGLQASCSVTVEPAVTGVTLTEHSINIETTGTTTHTLSATVTGGGEHTKGVSWSSSNESIATVDENGLVTAQGEGKCSITVKTDVGGFTDACVVNVSIPVDTVTVSPSTSTISVGGTSILTATVLPANATDKSITWSSSAEGVATVSANGVVTGVAAGTATITATSNYDGTKSGSCTITVEPAVTGVTLSDHSIDLETTGTTTHTLTATVTGGGSSTQGVTWSTSDSTVATVSNGTVTAIGEGTCVITVKTNVGGFTDTCVVNVSIPVDTVTVTPSTSTISVGGTSVLTATVLPANATDKSVTWSSSAEGVATVSANGVVTGVAAGTATITATSNYDGTKSGSCTITVEPAVTGVTLSDHSIDLETTGTTTHTLTATVAGGGSSTQGVTWSTSDSAVATVSGGTVTAVGEGTCVITVKTNVGGFTDTCVVNVSIPVSSVSVVASASTISVGGTSVLTATVLPANATDKSVTWSSSNTNTATVSENGVVTGVAAGTAKITATSNYDGTKKGECTITVVAACSGVTLNKTATTIEKGKTETLTATVTGGVVQTVTWSSSNESVASVDTNGNITANATGTAVIICKTDEGGHIATCTVTVADVTLNKTSASIAVGATDTLSYTIDPTGLSSTATYASSDPDVASVDSTTGVVTGVAAGSATITVTVTVNGITITRTCDVTVTGE